MAEVKYFITINCVQFCFHIHSMKITAYGWGFQPQNHNEAHPLEYWKAQLAWRCLETEGDDIEVLKRRLLNANITEVNPQLKAHLKDFMRSKVENQNTAKLAYPRSPMTNSLLGHGGQGQQTPSARRRERLQLENFQDATFQFRKQQAIGALGARPQIIDTDMPVRHPQQQAAPRVHPNMSWRPEESVNQYRQPGFHVARPQIQPPQQPGLGFLVQQPSSVAQQQRQERPQAQQTTPVQQRQYQPASVPRPHVVTSQNHIQHQGYQLPTNLPLNNQFVPPPQSFSSQAPIPAPPKLTPLQFQALFLSQQAPDPENPMAVPNQFVAAALSAFDEMETFRQTGDPQPLSLPSYSNNYNILLSQGRELPPDPLLSRSWDVYGSWILDCPALGDFCGDEPLHLEIYRSESSVGVQIIGTFYFEFAYKGVIRFCNSTVGPPKRTDAAEYVLAYPGHVTAKYSSWCFRWRGKEIGGEELIHLDADEVVYEISFAEGGRYLRGTWGSDATGRTQFTGKKVGDFEGSVEDMKECATEAWDEWTRCSRREYDRLFGWEAERVRVDYS